MKDARDWLQSRPRIVLVLAIPILIVLGIAASPKRQRDQPSRLTCQEHKLLALARPETRIRRFWGSIMRRIWFMWRGACRYVIEGSVLILVLALAVPAVTYIAFTRDPDNRSTIILTGFVAFAGLLAVRETVLSRRSDAYPRVIVRWIEGANDSRTAFRNTGIGTAYLRKLRVESRWRGRRKDIGFSIYDLQHV
jgi:hypothetical protein